jgi:hypothetical protein
MRITMQESLDFMRVLKASLIFHDQNQETVLRDLHVFLGFCAGILESGVGHCRPLWMQRCKSAAVFPFFGWRAAVATEPPARLVLNLAEPFRSFSVKYF